MPIRTAIRIELLRLIASLLAGGALGSLMGDAVLGGSLALLVLFLYHMWHAEALLKWLQSPKKQDLPDGSGIWRLINQASWDRWKQARSRKKQLRGIVSEFRASTAALPDAAVVLDAQLRISWFNQAARELLELESQRDAGLRIAHLLRHPEFSAYLKQADEENAGVEIPAPGNAAQTLWIRVIAYGQGQKLMIARDVTQMKRLEQSRRDFVANASHELRTPLTVIRGYLDMMADESGQGGEAGLSAWQQPLDEMRRQSGRMQKIISDLLKLANLEARSSLTNEDDVEMAALISGCLDEARILSQQQHRIHAELDDELNLRGNPAELHGIISNLMSNALRYTPAGGEVFAHWSRSRDGGAVLQVRDTGIGIAAAEIPRLTERFYRADAARSRETGGTGLGLAIVKHALERHDAQLRIQSQPGLGSTFSCHFPASRVTSHPETAP